MKKTVLLFVFVGCLQTIFAQSDTNYVDFYRKEYNRVYKNFEKDPQDVVNIVELAEFYSAKSNPLKSYSLAIIYFSDAEKKYIALVNDNSKYKEVNKLIKKKISITSIRKKKNSVLDDALAYVKEGAMSRSECDDYMKAFEMYPEIIKELKHVESKLAYLECVNSGMITSYANFVLTYPNSKYTNEALQKVSSYVLSRIDDAKTEDAVDSAITIFVNDSIIWYANKKKTKIAYRNALKLNTAEAYRTFLSKYPSCDEYVLALEKMDKLLLAKFEELETPRDYAQFATEYVDNSLADRAMDSLINMILNKKNIEALDIYLEHFKLDYRYADVFQTYYRRHIIDGSLSPLNYFASRYPDYPFTYSLNNDIERAKSFDQLNLLQPFDENKVSEYTQFVRMTMSYEIAFVALQRMVQKMIAKQRWRDALNRIKSQGICFEDFNVDNYQELIRLLEAPVDKKIKVANVFSPKVEVLNMVPTQKGDYCFYTKIDNVSGKTKIAIAKNIKGYWAEVSDLLFYNIENEGLSVYSLYDNDTKMLIGKDEDICVAILDTLNNQWYLQSVLSQPVNTEAYDGDAFMLPDGSGILMVSDRRCGFNITPSGGYFHGDTALASDIYFLPIKNNSEGWGNPINLGDSVNTVYSERSPVMSKDMKTMYFCSDGHGGLGYTDIYKTTRTNTLSWTQWSKPQNIGKLSNSGYREMSLSLNYDETELYVVSDRSGKYEVYSISLPRSGDDFLKVVELCPNRSIDYFSHTNKPLVTIWDYDSKKEIGKHRFENGEDYTIELFRNKRYFVFNLMEDYYSPMKIIGEEVSKKVEIDCFSLERLKKDAEKIPLYITYKNDRTVNLTDESYLSLNYLVDFLKLNSNCKIEIISNVNLKESQEAYYLSVERAESIKNYLVNLGIDSSRIIASGYGNVNFGGNSSVSEIEILFK